MNLPPCDHDECPENKCLYVAMDTAKPAMKPKLKYQNKIRFNCSRFVRISACEPAHCFNCMRRDGYPQNLGGDEDCKNYHPVK